VKRSKADGSSAAVVFLPERTQHFGNHGSDMCYCEAMYGAPKVSAQRGAREGGEGEKELAWVNCSRSIYIWTRVCLSLSALGTQPPALGL
jgi:hypothetical protein